MPILHFSGNFNFQVPYFNNQPQNDARNPDAYDLLIGDKNLKVKFDNSLTPAEVHQRLLCDPTKYFEFEFSEVYVRRITYDDGSCTDRDGMYDPIVGKRVMLKCLLVDISPNQNSLPMDWIELLLQTPLEDYRKYCIWRILSPYLIVKRKIAYNESYNIIQNWLNECEKLQPFNFDSNLKINEGLNGALNIGCYPISFKDLKQENPELYKIVWSNLT